MSESVDAHDQLGALQKSGLLLTTKRDGVTMLFVIQKRSRKRLSLHSPARYFAVGRCCCICLAKPEIAGSLSQLFESSNVEYSSTISRHLRASASGDPLSITFQ